jgi:hypothetical protein
MGRWLEDAELVAVRVGEHVPGPAVLDDGEAGEQGGAERRDPADLGFQVTGAQVEMDAVLALPGVRRPLQEHLDAGPVGGYQGLVGAFSVPEGGVAEDSGPEPCRAFQVGAVDHHDEFAPRVPVRLPVHPASLASAARCPCWLGFLASSGSAGVVGLAGGGLPVTSPA